MTRTSATNTQTPSRANAKASAKTTREQSTKTVDNNCTAGHGTQAKGNGAAPHDALALARYVLGRGWTPVPVPVGKSPKLPKWQLLKITAETVEHYFKGKRLNVGAQMGPFSNGLTDVDLDCAEACLLAPYFLPKTGAIYGRPGKPRSHYLYYVNDPLAKASSMFKDDQDEMIVELRMGGGGKGAQSVMPGSLHPSGSYYAWDGEGEPAQAACADLQKAVTRIAVAALLLRHWKGTNDCALGVCSFLARAGWKDTEIAHVVFAVCQSRGRGQGDKAKLLSMARDSIARIEKDEEVRGLPWMQEVFGGGVAEKIAKLVGFFQQEGKTPIDEIGAEGVSMTDFYAHMPMHNYVFAPSRDMWPTESINSRFPPVVVGIDEEGEPIKISPAKWLDQNRAIEQMTWAPGRDMLIRDLLIADGGWIPRKGVALLNQYKPGVVALGDARKAKPWIDLVRKVFPRDADHIIKFLAQRLQHPEIKINHALVLGSQFQGIGKDTILEPIKRFIGSWNFKEATPTNFFEPFNPWVKAVILRVNEAKDMGEVSRFDFYNKLKRYLAAPPDALECNEKNVKQYYVLNVMGVIITTNHLTDGIYLPAEDRRHYVGWSDCTPEDFSKEYWDGMWKWFDAGGVGHVAAYLATLDISDFNAKAPPAKTSAFWSIVNANRTSEESELADVLDRLGSKDTADNVTWRDAVTLEMITDNASSELEHWMKEHRNRKAVNHRLESCGYRAVTNPTAKDGYWLVNDRRCVIYALIKLPDGKRLEAAEALKQEQAEERARENAAAVNNTRQPPPGKKRNVTFKVVGDE